MFGTNNIYVLILLRAYITLRIPLKPLHYEIHFSLHSSRLQRSYVTYAPMQSGKWREALTVQYLIACLHIRPVYNTHTHMYIYILQFTYIFVSDSRATGYNIILQEKQISVILWPRIDYISRLRKGSLYVIVFTVLRNLDVTNQIDVILNTCNCSYVQCQPWYTLYSFAWRNNSGHRSFFIF